MTFTVSLSNKTSYTSGDTFSGNSISGFDPEHEIKTKIKIVDKYLYIKNFSDLFRL